VQAAGGHFIFTCKPSSHSLIKEYITGVELPNHHVTIKQGKKRIVHRYRWLCEVPLRDSDDAMSVNWFEMEIVDASGNVTDELWRLARQKLVTRSRFFNMIADAAALMFFPSWGELLRTVAFVRPPALD
jgi:hypothetical protein